MISRFRAEAAKHVSIAIFLALFGLLASVSQQSPKRPGGKGTLFLLAANLSQEYGSSDPVVIYRVSAEGQLVQEVTVLEGQSSELGKDDWTPVGVYSIHEVGPYLLVDFPHLYPRKVEFVSMEHPSDLDTVSFDPENFITDDLGHILMENSAGVVCALWPLMSVPIAPDGKGGMTQGQTTLRSVCKRPGGRPFIATDEWSDYKDLRFDGPTRDRETNLVGTDGNKLVTKFLGQPELVLGDLPSAPGLKFSHGATLDAANGSFLVASMHNDEPEYFDRNDNVFVRNANDGLWKRLPVLPVTPTEKDKMYYRLFNDWLVTSASAALLKANNISDTVATDVLSVVETGKQRDDLGVAVDPRTAPEAAKLSARRITLWNLADGRRIDLAIPEDDSEIVHVFDGHSVLLRIHDKLFFAEIHGSKLTDYKLAAYDSAIPHMHWAFYSSSD